jgi:mRNA interferase MazF
VNSIYFKDFDKCNVVKKETDQKEIDFFFKQQEVWWIRAGLNIGIESNGKGAEFARPVLILKKHNKYSCLVVSLTTKEKQSDSQVKLDEVNYPTIFVKLSQLKTIDSRRLVSKLLFVNQLAFVKVKESIRIFNNL